MERLTKMGVGCFEYALKDHKAVPGEFGTYDAFFDYSMAVKRLGHYEDTGTEPEEICKLRAERDAAVADISAIAKGGKTWMCPYCKHGEVKAYGIADCDLPHGGCEMPYTGFEWNGQKPAEEDDYA